MPYPPSFWRSPRLRAAQATRQLKIAPPPNLDHKPASLLMTLLPMGLMAGALVGVAFVSGASSSGGGSPTWLLFTLPMLLASSVATVATRLLEKRRHKAKTAKREAAYRQYLASVKEKLEHAAKRQREIALADNPPPHECLEIVQERRRSLWARTPEDADFGVFRLGTGTQPAVLVVDAPEQTDLLDPDPLIEQAINLQALYAQVDDIPICLDLRESGVIGIAGPVHQRMGLARAVLFQIVTHHAPSEVQLAIVAPSEGAQRWSWARWLPHLQRANGLRDLALGQDAQHASSQRINDLLDARARRVTETRSDAASVLPAVILLLDGPEIIVEEPALNRALAEGPSLGIYSIILSDRVRHLPQACQTKVRVGSKPSSFVSYQEQGHYVTLQPDVVSAEQALRFARAMAPIRLREPATPSDLPTIVTLLDLLGVTDLESLAVATRWEESLPPQRSLAAPIGLAAGGEAVALDLHERAHGPNGLVAGMVGTGKSELLQTIVASLAIHYHPHRVAFVLIDYKGGGMAGPFASLPHTLGVITNLQEGNLAERAIASLAVESERRQRLFAQAGVTHIDAYQDLYVRGIVSEPLPYLVIIVDEFAEMKTEKPETAKEFVSIARLGRAQGFRLILAMQKPAGIVDGQIEANTRFRLCLRVAQPEDSNAMLRCPDAAFLSGIGRAYFQVGMNEQFTQFQVAWSGASYDPQALLAEDPLEIAEVLLDGQRVSLLKPGRTVTSAPGSTQLQAVIQMLEQTANDMGIVPARRPWVDPLPEQLALAQVRENSEGWDGATWQPTSRWMSPVIGMLDNPAAQCQEPLGLPLSDENHLAVYGAPGYGKTVLLLTLVTSLAMDHPPDDLHVYILDFGGRLLKALEPLPHVGSVVTPADEEAVERLFQMLQRGIARRQELLGEAGAADLPSYRAMGRKLPALLVVIDNYPALSATFEWVQDALAQLVREGGNLGMHIVFTAGSTGDVRYKVLTSITLSMALRLADRGEYAAIVGRIGDPPPPIPGRALLSGNGLEFQCAGSLEGEPDAERMTKLGDLVHAMANTWQGDVAPPVVTLPELLPLSTVLPEPKPSADLRIPVGWRVQDLEPLTICLDEVQHLVVAGPRGCGKSTLLRTMALALAATHSPDALHLYLLSSGRGDLSAVRALPHTQGYGTSPQDAGPIMDGIATLADGRLASQESAKDEPPLVILIDDYADPFDKPLPPASSEVLSRLTRQGDRVGIYLILASSSMDWRSVQFSDPLAKAMLAGGSGFEFGTRDSAVLELRYDPGQRQHVPSSGLAFWANRGQPTSTRIATAAADPGGTGAWVERIAAYWREHQGQSQ
jgi:DNA segregation ATPase FtsK/SpoIIIE, S-DNA-T family